MVQQDKWQISISGVEILLHFKSTNNYSNKCQPPAFIPSAMPASWHFNKSWRIFGEIAIFVQEESQQTFLPLLFPPLLISTGSDDGGKYDLPAPNRHAVLTFLDLPSWSPYVNANPTTRAKSVKTLVCLSEPPSVLCDVSGRKYVQTPHDCCKRSHRCSNYPSVMFLFQW